MNDHVDTCLLSDRDANPIDRKEKPLPCPYCDSRFSRDDLINRHVRTFHPDAPPVQKPRKPRRGATDGGVNAEGSAPDIETPDTSARQLALNGNTLIGFNDANLSQLGGFDLLAAISTLSADNAFTNVQDPVEQGDMPVERTWFAFNWFSDFFKDLTEPATSENLHIRKVHTLDSPSLSPMDEGQLDTQRPWRPVLTKHVSSLYERIMSLEISKRLPSDFILPPRPKVSRYLSGYFGYFNPHVPIVHTQSFDFTKYSRMSSE